MWRRWLAMVKRTTCSSLLMMFLPSNSTTSLFCLILPLAWTASFIVCLLTTHSSQKMPTPSWALLSTAKMNRASFCLSYTDVLMKQRRCFKLVPAKHRRGDVRCVSDAPSWFVCVSGLLLLLEQVADFSEEHFFLGWLWLWSGSCLFCLLLLLTSTCVNTMHPPR